MKGDGVDIHSPKRRIGQDHQSIFTMVTETGVRLNVVLGNSGQLCVSDSGVTLGVLVKVEERMGVYIRYSLV